MPAPLPHWTSEQAADNFIREWATPAGGLPVTYTYHFYSQSELETLASRHDEDERYLMGIPFTEEQKRQTQLALRLWADVANVRFNLVDEIPDPDPGSGVKCIYFATSDCDEAWDGITEWPNPADPQDRGDHFAKQSKVFIKKTVWDSGTSLPHLGLPWGPGMVLLHEIGHGIGLSHTTNDSNKVYSGVYAEDTHQYAVMSYPAASLSGADYRNKFPQTPQLHDIAAVHKAYGANMSTRTGNTTYGFNASGLGDIAGIFNFSVNTKPVLCIWDAGGIDTLDLSGYTTASRIDLNEGAFSDAAGMTKNIAIAFGAKIENAVGGSGDDSLTGNALDNTLSGGGGDDSVFAALGNDILYGGAGKDTLNGGQGRDKVYGEDGDDWILLGDEDRKDIKTSGDRLNGGFGFDTVDYSGMTTVQIELDLSRNSANRLFVDYSDPQEFVAWSSAWFKRVVSPSDSLLLLEGAVGTPGKDSLIGDRWANKLAGKAGNDTLWGGSGKDTLEGGWGDDTIEVDPVPDEEDTFVFNQGDGNDTLRIHGSTVGFESQNILKLGGLSLDGIRVIRNRTDLVLTWVNNGTDSVTLENYYAGETGGPWYSKYLLAAVESADGTLWDMNRILAMAHTGHGRGRRAQTLSGDTGNNLLEGGEGDDTMCGGHGADAMNGGAGSDSYLFNLGDGHDTIDDASGKNRIVFGAGITASQLGASLANGRITLSIATGDSINFAAPGTQGFAIEEIEFANGDVMAFGGAKTITLVEDGSYAITAADLGFTDADARDSFTGVRIDSLPDAGRLSLRGANVALEQIISAADLAAGRLTFSPMANANGDSYASMLLSVQSQDGLFDSAPNTLSFNITAVNDAPKVELRLQGGTTPITGTTTMRQGNSLTGTVTPPPAAGMSWYSMTTSEETFRPASCGCAGSPTTWRCASSAPTTW